jgi:hypothetical protein
VAISRGHAEVEASLGMLRLLIDELGADVNKVLIWKRREQVTMFFVFFLCL